MYKESENEGQCEDQVVEVGKGLVDETMCFVMSLLNQRSRKEKQLEIESRFQQIKKMFDSINNSNIGDMFNDVMEEITDKMDTQQSYTQKVKKKEAPANVMTFRDINIEDQAEVDDDLQRMINEDANFKVMTVNSVKKLMSDHLKDLVHKMDSIKCLPLHYQRTCVDQYTSYSLCGLGLKPWWHSESATWQETLRIIQRASNFCLSELLEVHYVSAWAPIALLGFKNPVEVYLFRVLMALIKNRVSPQDWPILRDLNLDPARYVLPNVTLLEIETIHSRRIDASISMATTIHMMVRKGEAGWFVTILQDYHVFKTWLIHESNSIVQTVITGISLMINIVNNFIKGTDVIIGIPDLINLDRTSLSSTRTILTLLKDIKMNSWFWLIDTNWRTNNRLNAFALETTKALESEESIRFKIRERVNDLIHEIWAWERPFIYRFNPNLKPKIIRYNTIGGYTFNSLINLLTKLSVDFQRLPFCCNSGFPGRSLDHFLDGCTVSSPITEELRTRLGSWSLDTTKEGQKLIVETLGMLTVICDPFC